MMVWDTRLNRQLDNPTFASKVRPRRVKLALSKNVSVGQVDTVQRVKLKRNRTVVNLSRH